MKSVNNRGSHRWLTYCLTFVYNLDLLKFPHVNVQMCGHTCTGKGEGLNCKSKERNIEL